MSILFSLRFDSEDFCRATEAIVKLAKTLENPTKKLI